MEGEMRNFIAVWITVLASLCYCHTISKSIPKGTTRLCTFLPFISLFFYLPLHLTTIHLCCTTSFFITWLANFKLLLFAFGKGPLSSHPPLSLPHFLLFSCLPIKVQHPQAPPKPQKTQKTQNQKYPSPQTSPNYHKSTLNYAIKISIFATLAQIYQFQEFIHPKITMVLYCIHMYLTLELLLVVAAAVARAVTRLKLEPPFDEPYLSTSLQDFWGRRWNLMVTGILRPTVYDPVRSISARRIGKKWAPLPAILAAFIVSGLMHELIFYYMGRLRPTLETTCFFLIHGVCLAAEIVMKKVLNGKFRLPRIVAGPAVIVFVGVTALWLFFPPILRFDIDVKVRRESADFVQFVKDVIRVANVRLFNGK